MEGERHGSTSSQMNPYVYNFAVSQNWRGHVFLLNTVSGLVKCLFLWKVVHSNGKEQPAATVHTSA
jgi:hypothetical protein